MWKGYNYKDKPTTWRKQETGYGNRYTPEKNNKQMELEFNDWVFRLFSSIRTRF